MKKCEKEWFSTFPHFSYSFLWTFKKIIFNLTFSIFQFNKIIYFNCKYFTCSYENIMNVWKNWKKWMSSQVSCFVFRWFKFTLKPPYSIMIGNIFLAIWNTFHRNIFVKFGLKTPYDISLDPFWSILKYVNFWHLQGHLKFWQKWVPSQSQSYLKNSAPRPPYSDLIQVVGMNRLHDGTIFGGVWCT